MKEFRKVNTSVWHSKKFERLSHLGKLFYLYCLTAPQGNSVGCYKNPIGYIMTDLNMDDPDAIKAMIKEVSDTGLIRYHIPESTVFIERWFEYNPANNPKHALKLLNDIEKIPYPVFASARARELVRVLGVTEWKIDASLQNRLDTVSRLGDTETETETETETFFSSKEPKKAQAPKTEKPTLDLEAPIIPDNFDNDFKDFFAGWKPVEGRKGSSDLARKSYIKARKGGITHETLVQGREKYLSYCHRSGEKTRHAVTWLNQRGWTDELPDVASGSHEPRRSGSHQPSFTEIAGRSIGKVEDDIQF